MNKKVVIILGIIVLCVCTFLAGIFLEKSTQKPSINSKTFYARIEDIKENSILATGLSLNNINFRGTYQLTIDKDTMILWRGTKLKLEDLDIGDNISITYTDEFLELSSPTRLREVILIDLLDDSIVKNKDGYNNEF